MNKTTRDIITVFSILVFSYFLFGYFDVLENLVEWSRANERYELDEIIPTSMVLVFILLIFSVRSWLETVKKTKKLQSALHEIKELTGIIPICSYCKNIRDDTGVWNKLEAYIRSHSKAEFSHGICPECYNMQIEELEKTTSLVVEPGGSK